MKTIIRTGLALVLGLGLAASVHAGDKSPLAKKQESFRQLNWAYRYAAQAAAKNAPKAYKKAKHFADRAAKVNDKSASVRNALSEIDGYLGGKKGDAAALKGKYKATLKLVNAYKSIRKGDLKRAEAYVKEAEKASPGYWGLAEVRADIAASKGGKAEDGVDNEKDDDKDED